MRSEGGDRLVLGDHAALLECGQDTVADRPFGDGPPRGVGPRDALPGIGDDVVQRLRGAVVAGELGAAQAAHRPLHQVLGGLQGEAGPLQQASGAVVERGQARQGGRALRGQDAALRSDAGQ